MFNIFGAVFDPLKELPNIIEQGKRQKLNAIGESSGGDFPGCNYHPSSRDSWMDGLDPSKLKIKDIVWPGTHDSATNDINGPFLKGLAQCQSLTIYEQLKRGTRVLDIRVDENRRICHGIVTSYEVDVVINDVKRFLSETRSEILILEFRTEHGHENPPEFDKFLKENLGDHLIHQDDRVFEKTVSELLPKRVICIWKPQGDRTSTMGDPLWGPQYLKDDWIDTDDVRTKLDSNLNHLARQPPISSRKFFYRVEHTLTANVGTILRSLRFNDDTIKMRTFFQTFAPTLPLRNIPNMPTFPFLNFPNMTSVEDLAKDFRPHWRPFIKQCFQRNIDDRLQIFSTDYIQDDFVDACVGLTHARIEGMP